MKPQIKLCKPTLPKLDEISGQFAEILENGQVTNGGKYVQTFERELQRFFSSRLEPVTFCNGEMALYNLIRAHKIKNNIPDGSGVLVPSLTFVGTINAIEANGLKPVFCDVDETLTMTQILRSVCDYKMIISVGVYGNLPELNIFKSVSKNCNIPLILDAAPAFGSKYDGQYPDKYCDCIYSFHATKSFTTMEGGCAVTNDDEIRNLLITLRNFGQVDKISGNVVFSGLNSKMMEICAIIGLQNLPKFVTNTHVAKRYDEFFTQLNCITTMQVAESVECNYLYYPVILDDNVFADTFCQYLASKGIQTRRYYTACHTLTAYKSSVSLPFTDSIRDCIVALPIHADMTEDEINHLFETVKNYFK